MPPHQPPNLPPTQHLKLPVILNKPFAEVVESSLSSWTAQSWQWDAFPLFGSLVVVQSDTRLLFGLVTQVQTGSLDPSRHPFPYQKTQEELREEQPQIFEFLKTTFACLPVAYEQQGTIRYQLPPEPPKIHAFVHPATTEQATRFFKSAHYLHMLFGSANGTTNLDELLLATLRQLDELDLLRGQGLSQFMETISLLTGNDYRRLKLFLQRAQALLD